MYPYYAMFLSMNRQLGIVEDVAKDGQGVRAGKNLIMERQFSNYLFSLFQQFIYNITTYRILFFLIS
jgi:hypothetical protein